MHKKYIFQQIAQDYTLATVKTKACDSNNGNVLRIL